MKLLPLGRSSSHCKFDEDPHLKRHQNSSDISYSFFSKIQSSQHLGPKWLESLRSTIDRHGHALVGENCGITYIHGKLKVINEVNKRKFYFPKKNYECELITISRYPNAPHYYLTSNKDRLFADKYNTVQMAIDEAKKYTTMDKIEVKDSIYTESSG